MNDISSRKISKVLLISMPWYRPSTPSLGLSLLKAGLLKNKIPCDIKYFSLLWFDSLEKNLGESTYKSKLASILEMGCFSQIPAGEWLFSQFYYGQDSLNAEMFTDEFSKQFDQRGREFIQLSEVVPSFIEECYQSILWDKYTVVGFTSTFSQQFASLSLARIIKNRHPHLKIVFGGANCHGIMGTALLEKYNFIDYVFTGEADKSFPVLIDNIEQQYEFEIPNLASRRKNESIHHIYAKSEVILDTLPYPEFDDYFDQYESLKIERFFPVFIPVETSRGCWWAERSQCIFCGQNSDNGYRIKSPQRSFDEIEYLKNKYNQKSFVFTDTIIHKTHFDDLFQHFIDNDLDINFFCEVRSNLKKNQVYQLKKARCSRVQPGIESLSTPILKIMRKGVTAIQNIACLKNFREVGIQVNWNLLYGFPKEDPEEYEKMLPLLERITHLDPPMNIGPMRLVRFSPAFLESDKLGFENIRENDYIHFLYPHGTNGLKNLCSVFSFDYSDSRVPETYLGKIKNFVHGWQNQKRGILVFEKIKNESAIIHDTRLNRMNSHFSLSPVQAALYTFCSDIRSIIECIDYLGLKFPKTPFAKNEIEGMLEYFYDNFLMVREENKYLSVAMIDCEFVPWLSAVYV